MAKTSPCRSRAWPGRVLPSVWASSLPPQKSGASRAAKPGQFGGKEPASGFCTTKCVSCLTVNNRRNRLHSKKDGKRRGHEKSPGSEGKNRGLGRRIAGKKRGAGGRIRESFGSNHPARPVCARSAPVWMRGWGVLDLVCSVFLRYRAGCHTRAIIVTVCKWSKLFKAGKFPVSLWNVGTFHNFSKLYT